MNKEEKIKLNINPEQNKFIKSLMSKEKQALLDIKQFILIHYNAGFMNDIVYEEILNIINKVLESGD